METIVKYNVGKLKSEIKELVLEQKFLKNQRKTVNLVGERKIGEFEATMKHISNREKLRLMYAAYGIIRGKTFETVCTYYSRSYGNSLKRFEDVIYEIVDSCVIE